MNRQKNSHVDLINSLLADCKKPEDLVGEHGLLTQLSQSLAQQTVQVESVQAATVPIRKFDHD